MNKKCKQFEKSMGSEAMPKKGESIMIMYGRKRKKTICYHKDAGSNGWCGTCLRQAKRGEYGFCEDGYPPPDEEDLITVAKPSKHWGYCSKLCRQEEYSPKQLQVKLLIKSNSQS